jgi:hypothetical protein
MLGRLRKVAAVFFLLAPTTIPQDLAREVLLLSRVKRHLREELARTPNYTCLETISRFRDDPKSLLQSHKGLARQDTVRLEIVYTNGREWYGSPGAKSISIDNPIAFIGGGMIGTGAFAMMMHNILEGGIFTYGGEEIVDGRPAVKYSFRVPRLLKALEISMEGARGTVGEEGAIWVDPQSLDLIRAAAGAAEIPPFLPLQAENMNIDYARMRISGSDVLLAQQADSSMLDADGVESYNRTEFTHCRSYSATSEISFDAKPDDSISAAPNGTAPAAPAAAVPAFLEATVLLTTPVSDKDAVGALIEGKVSGNLVHKGKVAVPDGSLVHGRIRRLERYRDRGVFAVGLEFTGVEVRGESLPFYADLLRIDKDRRIQPTLDRQIFVNRISAMQLVRESITLPELPGVASFFIKGANFTLPSGFRMFWRTRGIIH